MIRKQIAVFFLAYNIVRGSLHQSAMLHDKIPRQLSYISAVQLITQANQQKMVLTGDLLSLLYVRYLKQWHQRLLACKNEKTSHELLSVVLKLILAHDTKS